MHRDLGRIGPCRMTSASRECNEVSKKSCVTSHGEPRASHAISRRACPLAMATSSLACCVFCSDVLTDVDLIHRILWSRGALSVRDNTKRTFSETLARV
jgi:hypothetical protein